MSELGIYDVPVTVMTGFLGVGKTTAILSFFEHRPEGERWAVLVNEFGDVGIDGAVLGEEGGLLVKEIPGGCICCSSGMELKLGLVRLLREVRPDRLFIEPTGLAHPASIVDMIRSPGLSEALSLRAVIGLVDPAKVLDPRYSEHDTYKDQVLIADVLVGNRCDTASDEQVEAFQRWANALYPPKLGVLTTSQGRIGPEWLDADPTEASLEAARLAHGHQHTTATTHGVIWPPSMCFDRDRLETAIQQIVRPGEVLPSGVLRFKGIFRTPRVWLHVDATSDRIVWNAMNYRRDSRVEVIVQNDLDAGCWDRMEAMLVDAKWRRPT